MEEFGEFSGFLIIASIALLSFRYILKFIFQKFGKDMEESFRNKLVKLMTLNKKLHPYVGYVALIFILIHVYLVTGFNLRFRFNELSGMLAASLILLNVFVGIIGQYIVSKPRPKWWKPMHRLLTILSILVIIIHIN